MPDKPKPQIQKDLKLEYNAGIDDIWLTNQNSLRKLIGVLGIALPILLYLVVLIDHGHTSPLYSVSHYYFTRASSIFAVIVSLLAVFLLIYKGKDPIDFYISSIAGLFALALVVFPTNNITDNCKDEEHLYSLTVLNISDTRTYVHYISAAIFLSCLAYMSLFLFTKSDKPPAARGQKKRRRNRIFRTCGVIMLSAILIILANFLNLISDDLFDKYKLTFWMETIAVVAFGVSWLTKAEVILEDHDTSKLAEPSH